jgi:hypothetical protein
MVPRGGIEPPTPMALNMGGIVLLVFAAGLAVNGLWFGAFLDKRNRIGLASFQLAAWTIVLFGGYSIMSVFNAGLLAQTIRDGSSAASAAAIGNVFPTMSWELWLTLGIVLGSPALSVLINNKKEKPGDERLELSPTAISIPQDPLAARESAAEASLSDLFMGESAGNEGFVDISRLQHLVITLLLLSTYVILLLEYVRAIGGLQIGNAVVNSAPVFASMPPASMQHNGIAYTVQAQPDPDQWAWSVVLPNGQTRQGNVKGVRAQAEFAASAAIDVWLRINKSKP